MNSFLDYIFYRTAELFFKRYGRRGFSAMSIISASQTLMFWTLILIINHFTAQITVKSFYEEFGFAIVLIYCSLLYINHRKYSGRYNKIRFRWKDEDPDKRVFNGILVLISLVSPLILFAMANNLIH